MLTSFSAFGENTLTCQSKDLYYDVWQQNGGAAPRPGSLIGTTSLVLLNKVVESTERHFGAVPPKPAYRVAFDESTKNVIEQIGPPDYSTTVYRVSVKVESPENPNFRGVEETVLREERAHAVP